MIEELLGGAFRLVNEKLGLTVNQLIALGAIVWAAAMSIHVLWACGFLAFMGVESPFAKADDFKGLQHSVAITARINLSRELRDQMSLLCRTKDPSVRVSLGNYIESLQVEYQSVTGQRYPETFCSTG